MRFRIGVIATQNSSSILVFEDKLIGNEKLLINSDEYAPLGTEFAGFHDWLHEHKDAGISKRVTGLILYPFDENVILELSRRRMQIPAMSEIPVYFRDTYGIGHSGGEQSFGCHKYYVSPAGAILAVLDCDGINELEYEDILRRSELLEAEQSD